MKTNTTLKLVIFLYHLLDKILKGAVFEAWKQEQIKLVKDNPVVYLFIMKVEFELTCYYKKYGFYKTYHFFYNEFLDEFVEQVCNSEGY